MKEMLILVDENDIEIGNCEKLEAHKTGTRHRAFSIILFNNAGEILLQRRSLAKYHSPMLWANSCCGHPRPGEDVLLAAERRLKEELNIETPLTKIGEVTYFLPLENGLIEHEYTHIFVGVFEGLILPNPLEVSEIKWESFEKIKVWMLSSPHDFASWFELYVNKYEGLVTEAKKTVLL